MMGKLFLCIIVVTSRSLTTGIRYQPNWNSLDSRPLPSWYDESKFGIFITWGLWSVPAVDNEWFWYNWRHWKTPEVVKYMKDMYRPDYTYPDFASEFTAELFNPEEWAEIFQASGAR